MHHIQVIPQILTHFSCYDWFCQPTLECLIEGGEGCGGGGGRKKGGGGFKN